MPLSEQEQRLLEEMERNLYRNDADFVAAVGGVRGRRPNYRAIVLGVLLAVAGVGAPDRRRRAAAAHRRRRRLRAHVRRRALAITPPQARRRPQPLRPRPSAQPRGHALGRRLHGSPQRPLGPSPGRPATRPSTSHHLTGRSSDRPVFVALDESPSAPILADRPCSVPAGRMRSSGIRRAPTRTDLQKSLHSTPPRNP